MYALETPAAGLPFTTRSSLQALLKSRGAVSAPKRNKWILPKDNAASQGLNINGEGDNTESAASPNSSQAATSEVDSPNGDQTGDFSYSQKLFHIDDGNLYSIFSPLQGRSYGMKPSFLRKQKCTVQECHGRGRKILRKGLKFHNFLPSESITSEKDNNIKEDQWKVHSECKLREEHGTKQIMVSNWFQNIKHTRESGSSSESHSPELLASNDSTADSQGSVQTANVYNLPGSLNADLSCAASPTQNDSTLISSNLKSEAGRKFSVLNSLLHSVAKSQSLTPTDSVQEHTQTNVSGGGQKRRRKPNQTRRIVPYTKYLSLMEESESFPLDLSLHTSIQEDSVKCGTQYKNCLSNLNAEALSSNCCSTLKSKKVAKVPFTKSKFELCHPSDNQTAMNNVNLPNYVNPLFSTLQTYAHPQSQHKTPKETTFEAQQSSHNVFAYKPPPSIRKAMSCRESSDVDPQSSTLQSVPKAKTRRKSQRSVIKQKLEDTFRQNGFLVKTKQVSDGDATFCKFRQLRKYTRYYLKSWQQHLPDEVHKMWKGFLPPKTVLPPASGTSVHSVNENPM